MIVDGIDFAQVEIIFERLTEVAIALAHPAGVGEMETVGSLVSYLLDHPRDIEPCLRFGISELPNDWMEKGRLSYHGNDGKIWRPENARRARLIRKTGDNIMTVLKMTDVEKIENYTRFLEANGWSFDDDGMWQRDRSFGTRLPLEGAFHLEHILMSLDEMPSTPTPPASPTT